MRCSMPLSIYRFAKSASLTYALKILHNRPNAFKSLQIVSIIRSFQRQFFWVFIHFTDLKDKCKKEGSKLVAILFMLIPSFGAAQNLIEQNKKLGELEREVKELKLKTHY